MRTGLVRPQHVSTADYGVPPLAAYEAWRAERVAGAANKGVMRHRATRATILRRIAQLHRAGDNGAEIGRCVGMTSAGVLKILRALPDHLK